MTPLKGGLDDLKAGARAAWALSVEAPAVDRPLRRFAHGFALTWVLVGIALRDDALRRGYLRTALPISLLTLALATVAAVSPWSPWEKHRRHGVIIAPPKVPNTANWLDDDDEKKDPDDEEEDEDSGERVVAAITAPDASVAPARTDAGPAVAPGVTSNLHFAVDDDDDPEEAEEPAHWSLPTLSALYAALAFVERCLLALTRDHQHLLSRKLCLATGATPEDEEVAPRLRFSFRWLFKRLKRKVRGVMIIGSIAGVAGIARALPPPVGEWTASAVAAVWAGYWLCVFALGAADLAWKNDSPEQPFFIKWCERARKVPVIGWLPGMQLRIWRWLLKDVRPACISAELAPWETAGLGLARLISGLPVINGFVRPAVSVAAQLALLPRLPAAPDA